MTIFNNTTPHSRNYLKADDGDNISNVSTTILRFLEFLPGDQFELVFNSNGEFIEPSILTHNAGIIITIGATGNYYADDIRPVYGIYMLLDPEKEQQFARTGQPSIAYQYDIPTRTVFRSIEKTQADVGGYYNFIGKEDGLNLIQSISYTREVPTHICFSRYFKRPVEYLFYKTSVTNNITSGDIYDGYDDENGYRKLINKYSGLYWDQDFDPNELFDDKENMEYSPYSLYVLHDEYLNGESILEHMAHAPYMSDDDQEAQHAASHLFEKYLIDRLVHAQSPEELLEERTLLARRLAQAEDQEEAEVVNEATPLYVLDGWYGKVYQVGVDFMYDPSITYNNENIDLREIFRYDLEDMEPGDTTIIVGNGVYGDIFYQKVTQTFSYDPTNEKNIWLAAVDKVKESLIGYEEEEQERIAYNNFNKAIDIAREEWQSLIEEV